MDIRKAGIIKCSADVAADCLTCESCILKRKLSFAAEWAPRVAEAKKQSFIRELVQQCNSVTMISSLLGILQPLQHKDFIYAKSKANPTYDRDLVSVMNVSNKSITSEAVEVYMAEDKAWFSSASFWAKLNYLLSILKRCNSFTIDNITSFLAKHYESERKHIINTNNGQRRDRSNAGISIYTHGDNGILCIVHSFEMSILLPWKSQDNTSVWLLSEDLSNPCLNRIYKRVLKIKNMKFTFQRLKSFQYAS